MKFKKPKNPLEGLTSVKKIKPVEVVEEMTVTCSKCNKKVFSNELMELFNVCPYCGHHFRITARQRIRLICDAESFLETGAEITSQNILDFPGYDKKLESAKLLSHENEGVVTGTCKIGGHSAAVFFMEPYFMMGSMGSAVGEKITRLFELATENSLPVVGFTVSGGARMQEGIFSLMQMAKTSGAVRKHSEAKNFYISFLTDPTTGGVTASFAMEADIILAEPYALIAFAGPRVIEQTIRKKLPDGFLTAEFLLEKGFVDEIVSRKRQKKYLTAMLKLHQRRENA